MLLHGPDCEEEGGRLTCTGTEKFSTRTWEDAWHELEFTVDQGEVIEGTPLEVCSASWCITRTDSVLDAVLMVKSGCNVL
jgi:hypothetical protein